MISIVKYIVLRPKTKREKRKYAERKRILRIKDLRSLTYDEYLKSRWWRRLRRRQLKKFKYSCFECGINDVQLHVHHLSYKNLGEERDEDLMVLCQDCHSKKHKVAI